MIVNLNSVEKTCPMLQEILEKHKSLFDGTLGCYKYETVSLNVREGVKPYFLRIDLYLLLLRLRLKISSTTTKRKV